MDRTNAGDELMTDRSAAAIKAHETRQAIKKARRTGDYSQDPRVHAIRTDPKISGPKCTGVVEECYEDNEIGLILDGCDWRSPVPGMSITSITKSVAHFRRVERLYKAQQDHYGTSENW